MQNPEQYTTDEITDMRKHVLNLAMHRFDISISNTIERAEIPATGTMGTVTHVFEHLHAEQRDFEAQTAAIPAQRAEVTPANNGAFLAEAHQNVVNAFANPVVEATPVQNSPDMYDQSTAFDLTTHLMEQKAKELASEPKSLDQMLIDAQRV